MDEPAEIARRDQADAALREDLISANARLARAATGLRADLEAGRITRAEAIALLVSSEQITERGAAAVLANDGLPGPVHIWGKSVIGGLGPGQLPPLITTEDD